MTWTLVIEVIFYALTFILLGRSRKSPLTSTWIMIALWIAIVAFDTLMANFWAHANNGLGLYVGFLLFGRVVYLWHSGYISGPSAALQSVATLGVYLALTEILSPGFLLAPGGWVGIEPIVSYGYALILFLGLMVIAPTRTVQPFTLLGDISYSLYLLHLPVGITVLNLLDLAGVPESVNTLIAIVVSIAVSWVAWRCVEVPSQVCARRLLARRQPLPDRVEAPIAPFSLKLRVAGRSASHHGRGSSE